MTDNLLAWLVDRLDSSPTPYHAVAQVKSILLDHGFKELYEVDQWQVEIGGRYFVIRRDSSIIAFKYGQGDFEQSGIRIIGAHTDSPTLKVQPRPEKVVDGYFQLGIEVYGGVLLAPWFDRDLSLAGRVSVRHQDNTANYLVNFVKPIAVIPSLAIHLDRLVNEGRAINPQEQMRPILAQGIDIDLRTMLKEHLSLQGITIEEAEIIDFDLSFYDAQGASQVGLRSEFLASARLDNLLSCFVGLNAFVNAGAEEPDLPAVLALFDHEEVGSQSDIGARSNFLQSILERLVPDRERLYRTSSRSALLSVDNAHGVHPNFRSKHDESHGPIMNAGPVVKYDANQGYATSSQSAVFLKFLAQRAGVPLQSYVTRADLRCGSTIGPMTAASSGIATVDLGVATLAMHSIRELAGAKDIDYLCAILAEYLKTRSLSL